MPVRLRPPAPVFRRGRVSSAVVAKASAASRSASGIRSGTRELLERALTHRSFSNEQRDLRSPNNERLEFLGDTVLGFVVGDLIYRAFPNLQEGALSKIKAHLVSATTLWRQGAGARRSAGTCGWEPARPARAARRSCRSSPTASRRSSRRSTWTAACRPRRPFVRRTFTPDVAGHRRRRPVVPRLQDGAAGDRAGLGLPLPDYRDRRRVRPGPREDLRRGGLLGRGDVRLGRAPPSARPSARRPRKR